MSDLFISDPLYPFTYWEYEAKELQVIRSRVVINEPLPFEPQVLQKSAATYRSSLRAAVRGLWSGALDFDQAFESFDSSISIYLTQAWNEGAALCAVSADELTNEEQIERTRVIQNERARVFGYLLEVEEQSKAEGFKLGPHYGRLELWVNRYPDTVNRAKVMACANEKLQWLINQIRVVKKNCASCLKLNGKVKRASVWFESGIRPQNPPNPFLICGGWQ